MIRPHLHDKRWEGVELHHPPCLLGPLTIIRWHSDFQVKLPLTALPTRVTIKTPININDVMLVLLLFCFISFWFLLMVTSFSFEFSGEATCKAPIALTILVSDWKAKEQFPKETVPEQRWWRPKLTKNKIRLDYTPILCGVNGGHFAGISPQLSQKPASRKGG